MDNEQITQEEMNALQNAICEMESEWYHERLAFQAEQERSAA